MSARTRWPQAARFLFCWFLLLFLSAVPGSAQQRQPKSKPGTGGGGVVVTPDCVKGCIPPSQLSVTPDGGSAGSYVPNVGSGSYTFYVANYGSETDYDVTPTCRTTGPVTCTGVSPSSLTIDPGQQLPVTATFTVGAVGSGKLVLTAFGGSRDTGYVSVTVAVPNGAPAVSLAPHNPNVRDYSKCVASCFDMLWSHTTPAYYSLGQPRSITLVYNSATAHPTPVIQADVTSPVSGAVPTSYVVQVQRRDNNAYLTLLNGQTSVYFAGPSAANATSRVAAALDAAGNGLGTGVYDVNFIVTANFASGPSTTTVTTTSFIVVDRKASAFGAGFWLGGWQRVVPITGGALVIEGDGSAFAYRNYKIPGGTTASLSGSGSGWRRTYLDGSYVDFNAAGRMTQSVDRFGRATTIGYTDTLPTSITDPVGKTQYLVYFPSGTQKDKLWYTSDPADRRTILCWDATSMYCIYDPDGARAIFYHADYATNPLITAITDRAGNTTDFTYDALNRLQSAQAPAVKLYDGTTQRPTATQQAPELATWQPALAGTSAAPKAAVLTDSAVAWVADPLGARTTFRIDRWGGATWTKDALGRVATATYDSMGRPTYVTEPNNHQTKLEYGFFLGPAYPPTFYPYQLSKVTDMNTGRVLTYGYNASYDLTGIGGDTEVRYFDYYDGNGGPAGALKAVRTGATGTTPLQSFGYDNLARVTRVTYGDTTKPINPFLPRRIQTIQYDPVWGNVNYVKDPDGNVTRYHFDALGRTDTTYAPTLGATGVAYNVMNADSVVRNALGQFTRYSYNLDGTLARLVDPKGQVYKWSRNTLGALVAQHDLADTTKADSSLYDLAGRVRKVKTRRGDEITLTYDVLGRLISRSGPDFPTDYFEYDPQNRYVKAWNAGAFDSLAYDLAGRMVGASQRLGTTMYHTSYTYDTHNRVTNRNTTYNSIVNAALGLWNYLQVGPPTSRTLAGVYQQSTFGQSWMWLLDSLHYSQSGTGQWHEARVYNGAGLQLTDTFSVATTAAAFTGRFTYDSLHRLQSQSYAGRPKRAFKYDVLGRLINACDSIGGLCKNEFSNTTDAYRYDEAGNRFLGWEPPTIVATGNRISTTAGWLLTYDANGNLVAKCGEANCVTGNRYVWDALSRLKEVRTAGNALIASFTYDALGRRTVKTVGSNPQYYLYDGDQVIRDIDAFGQTTREYGYYEGSDRLLGIQQPDWTGVAITDPVIGTVRGLAHANGGAPLKNFDMTAWGKVPADTGAIVPVRMGGQRYDVETGLYHMRARYYDPDLGRFLSEDPIGIAGGLNLYAYAGNDPVNQYDRSGTDITCTTVKHVQRVRSGDGPWGPWETNFYQTTCSGFPDLPPAIDNTQPTEASPSKSGGSAASADKATEKDAATSLARACVRAEFAFYASLATDALTVVFPVGRAVVAARAARGFVTVARSAELMAGARTAVVGVAKALPINSLLRSPDAFASAYLGDASSLLDAVPFVATVRAYDRWSQCREENGG